eukprot:jgi/Chlat1/1236/Chrsp115S00752
MALNQAVFSHFKPGLVSSFQPELVLVLEYLVFHFSIWRGKPTPGNGLMNLRYRDERAMHKLPQRTGIEGPGLTRTQCIIFGIATFGLRYFWERLDRLSTFGQWSGPWGALTWRSLLRVKASLRVLQTLNSFAFLRFGRQARLYPRLIERVLQARLVYSRPNMNRAVSFEYMNRQLVWQELSELLLFILPLINIGKIRRFLVDRFSPAHSSAELPAAACSICFTNPARTPFESVDCGHMFCYYCVRANCEADRFFRCSRCSKPVGSIRRCRTQLVVELNSSSDAAPSKQLR